MGGPGITEIEHTYTMVGIIGKYVAVCCLIWLFAMCTMFWCDVLCNEKQHSSLETKLQVGYVFYEVRIRVQCVVGAYIYGWKTLNLLFSVQQK